MRSVAWTVLLLLGPVLEVGAVPVDHGNFAGANLVFEHVTESGFGTPAVTGNNLDFFPSVFGSSGSGGASDTDLSTLSLALNAAPGFAIHSLTVSEQGTYNLLGSGTAATIARVTGSVSGEILELSSGVLSSPIPFSASIDFSSTSSSGGEFNLVDDLGLAVVWSGALEVDVDALVQAAGFSSGATVVNVNLDNVFTIQSETGSISLIARNQFDLDISAQSDPGPGVIPEPRAWLLLLAGMCLVLGTLFRRTTQVERAGSQR